MTLDSTTVDRRTIKSATKLLLVTLGLLGVLTLASFLPGVDRAPFGVPFLALADAVVTLAIVAVLLSLAPRLATLVRTALDGPREPVEHVASAVYWLVALVAVLVAHWGLASLGTTLLGEAAWLYDLLFLLASLVPLVAVAVRLSATVDPAADAVADALAGDPDGDGDGDGTGGTDATGAGDAGPTRSDGSRGGGNRSGNAGEA